MSTYVSNDLKIMAVYLHKVGLTLSNQVPLRMLTCSLQCFSSVFGYSRSRCKIICSRREIGYSSPISSWLRRLCIFSPLESNSDAVSNSPLEYLEKIAGKYTSIRLISPIKYEIQHFLQRTINSWTSSFGIDYFICFGIQFPIQRT